MIVIDASLAVKLVIRESDTDQARAWFEDTVGDIAASDLIAVEVSQAIVRRVNARDLSAARGRQALEVWRAILERSGLTLLRASPAHVDAAADLAISLGHPVKDCLYLVLAIEQGATLITADPKFHHRAALRFPMIDLFRP